MDQPLIISLGSINVDFQMRAPKWPAPGDAILGQDFRRHGGGKGANVAYLARRLGVPSRLIAHVGDDLLAREALLPLQQLGVDLSTTKAVSGFPTGIAMILVHSDGKKSSVAATNANYAWTANDADEAAHAVEEAPTGSVLVVDVEVPPFVVKRAVEAARKRRHVVVLDPSPPERITSALFPQIDCITPNIAEAEQLTGLTIHSPDDAFRAGEVLTDWGVGIACIKLRDGGCALVSAQLREHIPSKAVEAVDTTGAGDAFCAALAVALLEGRSIQQAAAFAVAAAECAVGRYGSQPSYPSRHELHRQMQQHH